MKKRLLLFLCIFTLLLSTAAQAEDVTADVPAPAPSAEKADTLSPFARTRSYDGRFTDVDASAWYHDAVAALYEYGLTEGVSSSAYAPEGSVTIAELVTFAARLHALERGAAIPAAAAGEAWYQPYVRYLKAEKCLGDELDGHYPEAATRAQTAGVLAPALSTECYDERNAEAVTVGYASHRRITDVDDYTPYQSDILRLYKWGIVGGVDEDGSFHPNDTLKRSELAALVVRMVEPSARLTLSWQSLSYRSAAGTTWGDLIAACRGLRRAGSRRRQRHRRADPKDAPRRRRQHHSAIRPCADQRGGRKAHPRLYGRRQAPLRADVQLHLLPQLFLRQGAADLLLDSL